MAFASSSGNAEWFGPGARRRGWRTFNPGRALFSLFIPPKGQKVVPTKPGMVLFVLALAIGVAAYNTASNILFITLSLLLSTIIVSGILSWLNFRRMAWRISLQPPFRAGEQAIVGLEVLNDKKFLPVYGLVFDFKASSGDTGKLTLRTRLDPGESRRMEWSFKPQQRGRDLIEMTGVGSQFPFGFLYKHFGGRIAREVYVWPTRVAYRANLSAVAAQNSLGDVLNRTGGGNEFINLREYQIGDSYRQVHWKVSARQRKLMVRELIAENHSGFFVHVDTPTSLWSNPKQFERLCSLVASLSEDLFRQGQLIGAVINGQSPFLIRRMADLELLLDQLAVLEPVEQAGIARSSAARNVIYIEPSGPVGVNAIVCGQTSATA
jgi:uncharacterized protein (DUF58 family)